MSVPALLNRAFLLRTLRDVLFQVQAYCTVDLFTNNITPGEDDSLALYTLANYPGYAQQRYPTVADVQNNLNKEQLTPSLVAFSAPTSGATANVYGFVVAFKAVGGTVFPLCAARFAGAPIALTVGGPGIALSITLQSYDVSNP